MPLGTLISLNALPIGISQESSSNPISNATGSVTFTDSAASGPLAGSGYRNVPFDSSGVAEVNLNFMPAGFHSVTAAYSGDLSYNASTSDVVSFQVAQGTTSAIATTNTSTVINGQQLVLGAQLTTTTPANASLAPTGTITFTDTTNNTVPGTTSASIGFSCQGATTYCVSTAINPDSTQFVAGNNSIVVSYGGDSNFLPSGNSPAITVNCQAGCYNASGYTLGLAFYSLTSGIISAGGSATTTVDVGPGGGFTGNVNLTCTVTGTSSSDQYIPTCSFNPTQVNITNTQAVESTLTINTTAASTSMLRRNGSGNPIAAGTVALTFLALLALPVRRIRQCYLLAVITLLLVLSGVNACGGGGSSGGGSGGGGGGTSVPGTTADTYTVTFKAADAATGTVTAQDYFKITVN
ncbi:Ig-like domain-containing protein [Terracidiphilus gabretensis]|uniref:Ig-like domain-containing protein n=1 Tax=Terracidiphilus gabretensis TaxID=1577687 RepID=UPI00071B3C4C|nr:Ig-like domain-containing protein [Terracidiphilus gabretensis]